MMLSKSIQQILRTYICWILPAPCGSYVTVGCNVLQYYCVSDWSGGVRWRLKNYCIGLLGK